jgi:hypothetical protein
LELASAGSFDVFDSITIEVNLSYRPPGSHVADQFTVHGGSGATQHLALCAPSRASAIQDEPLGSTSQT